MIGMRLRGGLWCLWGVTEDDCDVRVQPTGKNRADDLFAPSFNAQNHF